MKKHNFITPKIKSIGRATADELYGRWQFWGVLAIAIISSAVLSILLGGYEIVALIPFAAIILYAGFVREKIRVLFWKQFAKLNGWKYTDRSDMNEEQGIMFRQGHDNCISLYSRRD